MKKFGISAAQKEALDKQATNAYVGAIIALVAAGVAQVANVVTEVKTEASVIDNIAETVEKVE